MGVPGLFKWISERWQKVVLTNGRPAKVSSLIFDLNSLIHDLASRVYGYSSQAFTVSDAPSAKTLAEVQAGLRRLYFPPGKDESDVLENELFEYIFDVIQRESRYYRPEQLIVAVDGVPPAAKIQQQRLRRFNAEKTMPATFNSNAITPGTQFMARLSTFLRDELGAHAQEMGAQMIYYTGPEDPGEGEHKFMALMRSGVVGGSGAKLIYGMDTDLIILGLLVQQPNILLVRENAPTDRFENRTYLNIDLLREKLKVYLMLPSAIPDFVLLSYLVGNDFAPRPLAAGANQVGDVIQIAIEAYRQFGQPLTKDGAIIWPNYAAIFTAVAERESALVKTTLAAVPDFEKGRLRSEQERARAAEAMKTIEQGGIGVAAKVDAIWARPFDNTKAAAAAHENSWLTTAAGTGDAFDYETFRAYWYRLALGLDPLMSPEEEAQNRAYLGDAIFDALGEVTPGMIEKMCRDYLTMLAWSYHYYSKGSEISQTELEAAGLRFDEVPLSVASGDARSRLLSLALFYPHLHAPLYSDLAIVARTAPPEPDRHLASSPEDRAIPHPVELLLAVLPPGVHANKPTRNPLLPSAYGWLMSAELKRRPATRDQLLEFFRGDYPEVIEELKQRLPSTAGANEIYRQLVSETASVAKNDNRIVVPLEVKNDFRWFSREDVKTFSPIADLYPIRYRTECYTAKNEGVTPRIPLADFARIRGAFDLVNAHERAIDLRGPLLLRIPDPHYAQPQNLYEPRAVRLFAPKRSRLRRKLFGSRL